MKSISGGEKNGLGGTRKRGVVETLPPRLKALGEGHIDVGRPKIGRGSVGVEVLGGRVAEIGPLGAALGDEVIGGGKLEATVAVVLR